MIPLPAWSEQGRGPRTLVFLHGIGGNRHAFDDQLAAFAGGWRAVAWDMPGYGESPALADMTFPALADSLAVLLDRLRLERAVIVGHSMGGMVAQELAARHPDRIAALVLSATSPAFGKPGGTWQQQFLAQRLKPLDEGQVPADFAEAVVRPMFASNPDGQAVARAVACMAAVPAETYRAALHCLVGFDRRDALGDISSPTLVLAAEKDGNAPPAVMERMAEKIPGARYHCIPGAGHLANLERPDLFNAALRGFLETLPD